MNTENLPTPATNIGLSAAGTGGIATYLEWIGEWGQTIFIILTVASLAIAWTGNRHKKKALDLRERELKLDEEIHEKLKSEDP